MDVNEEGNRIAERVTFSTCCLLFERIKSSQNTKTKRLVLSRFIHLWEDQYSKLDLHDDTRPAAGRASFYPCLRLLLPEFDRARPAYGLRETALARLYIKAFGIPPNGPAAQRLNQPAGYAGKGADFADLLYEAVQNRCREDNLLSLKDANDLLDRMANSQNSEDRLSAMTNFLRSATAVEQKWMVRLIVRRRSGCGLSVTGVLQCLHPAAPGLWNVTQDLCILCQRISELDVETPVETKACTGRAPDVTLFTPFRPMLCERSNSPQFLCQSAQKLYSLGMVDHSSARILLETKYDGERVQIHKSGNAYRYWSRNCLEWTSSYGANGESTQAAGTLTPRLHAAFAPHVQDCIIDGEIMAYNTWTASLVPKTCGFDVKRSRVMVGGLFSDWFAQNEASSYQPCVVAFDLIYLNGKSLTATPLLERKRLLAKLFVRAEPEQDDTVAGDEVLCPPPTPILEGTIYLSGWCTVPVTADHVTKVFNDLIDSRQEGVVAKLTVGLSPYLPGRRLHGGWWKLKPDYVDGLLADLDCLVVGGYFLSVLGRKTKRIGHFLCAVKADDEEPAAGDVLTESCNARPNFLSFCRVSNGLTMNQLKEVNNKLRPHWKSFDRKHPNTGPTEWLRVTSERPDVWIAPQHSITFQIHASELTPSSCYATGLTVRFPRIVAVREDKSWQDCLTMNELKRLNHETEGKLAINRVEIPGSDVDSDGDEQELSNHTNLQSPDDSADLKSTEDLDDLGDSGVPMELPRASSTPVKKRKTECDIATSPEVDEVFSKNELSQSSDSHGFLSGLELCLILSADNDAACQKAHLEERIHAVGGTVVQNAGPSTFCVVADKITVKIKNLIGHHSINPDGRSVNSNYNIARLDWLSRTLDRGELLAWKPDDLLAMTSRTARSLSTKYDSFGDSFSDPIDVDELRILCTGNSVIGSSNPLPGIQSAHQWKLTQALFDELKPQAPSLLGPLFLCYILVVSCRQLTAPIPSAGQSLLDRMLIADLRRLGATVLHYEHTFTEQVVPDVVQFVARNLRSIHSNSGMCEEPDLSHVLLLGDSIHSNIPLLNLLRAELQNARLCAPCSLRLVNEAWAMECIQSRSRCVETIIEPS